MNDVSIEVAMSYCHKQGIYPRLEEHDEQIRAKAIDEFTKELYRVLNIDGVCFPKTIDRIAEQLKEQNNGSN